jgi:hypothetical protein
VTSRLRASLALSAAAVLALAASSSATGGHSGGKATPRIGHVFTIVLENSEFEETFLAGQQDAPYLTSTLPSMGTLAVNYFGTGHSSLDNYIAMTSGQGPNALTQGDCDEKTTMGNGTVTFDADGQALGAGCTYPASVKSLSDQLDGVHTTWRAYMQGMDAEPLTKRTTCRNPFSVVEDPPLAGHPQANSSYKNKHNPWAYYHATFDRQDYCDEHVVPLGYLDASGAPRGQLVNDLRRTSTTPEYSFITPDQCDDAHDACGGMSQLAGADAFLKAWVPLILSSPAYKKDGLLVIAFDEGSSDLACCGEKKGPNLSMTENNGYPIPGPVADGGGKTGIIFVGKSVPAGVVDLTHQFNHYSYLRSMEDLFGVTSGGSDSHGHLGYAGQAGLETFQEAGLFSPSSLPVR